MSEKIANTRIAVITELACSKSITMKFFSQSYDKMIHTVPLSQVHENIVNYVILHTLFPVILPSHVKLAVLFISTSEKKQSTNEMGPDFHFQVKLQDKINQTHLTI